MTEWLVLKLNLLKGNKKKIVQVTCFIFIFFMPVADDIAGGIQFRKLCAENTAVFIDYENARNATIQLVRQDDKIINKIIPIREDVRDWVDSRTGKTLIKYTYLNARGGWLSHLVGFPQGSPPYTFDGSCGAKKPVSIMEKLNITEDTKNYYGE
ncbi:MAG: hypothetical protein KJ856_10450 [Gammaproteobacteria bacterium]|nr:hypothetical protein [Gammaproteobacteria bacterium]MBU1477065.1 hypothetical protein [Gammaproteobacteria bacterium]MBU2003657.1 hypothetical protein [Gammaproteobacteria bacterium]MBU2134041.1 hypothetical protein [Gammaproteobacteria bacterium]MBU2187418.1 hypothetical protein [Gammaproteobacteria bacterium]